MGSNEDSAPSVNASSIKITDVTQDGDTLTFAITSQKSSSSAGVCVFRTYEDFEWLQQSLFSQEDVPGLQGVIFPPLPGKPLPSTSLSQAKALKQLGFLALGDEWMIYSKALELYLHQVAAHTTLSNSKTLYSFLNSTESPGKQRGKKGILNRLSQAMEEMRKEGHKDVDEFFQSERDSSTNLSALFKLSTEKFLDVVLNKQRLALACGHFSTSLHLCVNQDNPTAVAFSKICLKLSDIIEAVKINYEKVSENDISTLGLGLDLESRYQEAKREMLFRRTCKLVELETANRNAERAKPNKKAIMEGVQKATQKEFNIISSVAKQEIEHYHRDRVSLLRDFLICWCEKQLSTARESSALLSQHLDACNHTMTVCTQVIRAVSQNWIIIIFLELRAVDKHSVHDLMSIKNCLEDSENWLLSSTDLIAVHLHQLSQAECELEISISRCWHKSRRFCEVFKNIVTHSPLGIGFAHIASLCLLYFLIRNMKTPPQESSCFFFTWLFEFPSRRFQDFINLGFCSDMGHFRHMKLYRSWIMRNSTRGCIVGFRNLFIKVLISSNSSI
ncbi:hypothetical protein AOLI_G00009190 [Acnodon oligacanthus]